jgi:hypothetical protein
VFPKENSRLITSAELLEGPLLRKNQSRDGNVIGSKALELL